MLAHTKIEKLADRFELKLEKFGQADVQQTGTSELFFDNAANQQAFGTKIMSQDSLVYKTLLRYYNIKNGAPCSFNLKIDATPGESAKWILEVNPPELKNSIKTALNMEFEKLMNKMSMNNREKKANALAKQGAGSGTLDVGSLDLN